MTDPRSLFRLEPDAAARLQHAPVLVVALDGFIDAGQVRSQLVEHMLETLNSAVVASFDVDQLVDYRGRRPLMTFSGDHWSGYDDPSLLVHRLVDDSGQPFLLLHGVEPDYRWEAFAEAVHQLCMGFGVRTMVSAHGIPMAVPHTRPVGMSRYASDPSLLEPHEPLFGEVQVPGSADSLLHMRLAEAGVTTMGVAVHVPHYLAEAKFGDAAVAALGALTAFTGLHVPQEALAASAELNRAEIARELAASPEAREVVEGLEQRYDRFVEGQRRRSLLASKVADLPSAEQIGAVFEEFLKEQAGSGGDEGQPEGGSQA